MAGSETPVAAGANVPLVDAVEVHGGGRRKRVVKAKGSIPIGVGAFVAGIVLLWIGLDLNDAVEGVARAVVGLLAVLTALRAAERFRRQQVIGAAILAVVAVGLALFAVIGPLDRIDKIVVVLAALTMMFIAIDRIAKVVKGEQFDTGLNLCFLWIFLVLFGAIFAGLLPLAEHQDTTKTISIPGNARPDLFSNNPLGTNNFSLDLLARSIYGARVSLLTATFAVMLSLVIGGSIGMLAGYFRGKLDVVVGLLTDTVLAFPALILLIAIITVLGRPEEMSEAIVKVGIGLAIVGLPTMTRLSRANTLVFAQREFVLSARSMGAKNFRIIFREIAPNVALPLLSYAFIVIAVLIVAEGSLSFLGLGLKPPKPTWGNMIAEGQQANVLKEYPHIPMVPGLVMFLTVYSFNRVGEWARSKWDPREAKV
ncbi:MAG TPA: ABC transporter permease [Acidimicrobiales bacterium]|nr:ABC transporter permease [Acidimicrobiales bacterium]